MTEVVAAPRTLSDQQRAAVAAPLDAPGVRVLAGPGAGKTFVMEQRVAHLLAMKVDPGEIVCVTLSKRMATEMWERLERSIPGVNETGLAERVCTIHAYCFRELKRLTGRNLRVPKAWELTAQYTELPRLVGLDGESGPRATPATLEAWVNASKAAGIPTERCEAWFDLHLQPDIASKVARARQRVDAWLTRTKQATFPDMLLQFEFLLRDPSVRAAAQRQFVIVDEGQDTGGQATRILTAVAERGQYYIVGDLDQLLYRFAGATPEANLGLGFEQLFGQAGLTFMLETNYRSTAVVVATAQRLIDHNYGSHNAHLRKTLRARTDAGAGEPFTFALLPDAQAEAVHVAERVQELVAAGARWGDFYVAARLRAVLAFTERELLTRGLPFVNLAGASFWTLTHVAALTGYLELALDGGSVGAYSAVYNIGSKRMRQPFTVRNDEGKVTRAAGDYCNHRYLGKQFLADYPSYDRACADLTTDNLPRRYQAGVADLVDTIDRAQFVYREKGVTALLEWLAEEVILPWYAEEHGLGDEGGTAAEDLAAVTEIAGLYTTVKEFLQFVEKSRAAAVDPAQAEASVVLGTVHRLKGLERPHVILCGAAMGILPSAYALGWVRPHEEVPPPDNPSLIEDERCIAYVAVTRAKQTVHVTAPAVWRKQPTVVSLFVAELGLVIDTQEADSD